ncbi:hypothetical protein [Micromonospora aurantiaca (nom. illeg.)]|uniref:hypothetical protein n=1 Tax=Micromonospora aurantiaca (nom. illeg.) TaxID=47850 RepID=UPI0036B4EBBB
MRDLTPEQSDLVQRFLAQHVAETQGAGRELAEAANRLQTRNAQAQGQGFLDLVASEQEKGLSYIEAVYKVGSEHPDLYEKHRQGSYNRRSI